MGTLSVLHQLKILPALTIWAGFGAIFEKKLVKKKFSPFIPFINIYQVILSHKMIKNVKSIEYASFKWMISFLAIQAKGKFTMLASSKVLFLLKRSQGSATI